MGRVFAGVAEARPNDGNANISNAGAGKARSRHERGTASLSQFDQVVRSERRFDTTARNGPATDSAEANSQRLLDGDIEHLKVVIRSADKLVRLNLATSEWLRQVARKLREQGVSSFAKFLEGQADYILDACLQHQGSIRHACDATDRLQRGIRDVGSAAFMDDAPFAAGSMTGGATHFPTPRCLADEKSLRIISDALRSSATS